MWAVTGATGFVGYHFLAEWKRRRKPVPLRLLVRDPTHPTLQPYIGEVEIQQSALQDAHALFGFCSGAEAVIHLAATISFSPRARAWMHQTNVEGTRNLVNAALEAGVRRFVYLSSIAALSRPASSSEPLNEDTLWEESPYNTYYGYTKYLGEKEVWRGGEEGLSILIFNPGIILGPYLSWEKGSPAFFRMIWRGLPFYPVGSSGFVGVSDVIRAIFMGMELYPAGWGKRYILVAENRTYKEIFEAIARALGRRPPRLPIPRRMAVGFGWLMEHLGRALGLPAAATRETARTSSAHFAYNGNRITQTWPFVYTPIREVIEETAKVFLSTYAGAAKR
ncbi:MAG: NAD-dependent epimerase/dehydratase family protein [Bacteroidia bacterium]